MAVPVAFFLQNREIHGPCSATGEKGDWSSVDDCNRCFQMIRKWAIHPTCRMRIYVDLDLFFLKSSLCESAMIYMEPHIYIYNIIYIERYTYSSNHIGMIQDDLVIWCTSTTVSLFPGKHITYLPDEHTLGVNHSHGVDYDLYDEHHSSAMSFAA